MRAAEAIEKALLEKHPTARVTVLDTFRYASPVLEKLVLGTYMEILKLSPAVYGYLYRQAERGRPLSGKGRIEFNRLLNVFTAPKLIRFIRDFSPQVIISTHPFSLGVLSVMKVNKDVDCPVVGVITDFTVHSFWVFSEVDCYLVGNESLVEDFTGFGISRDRVRATGIPIDPVFSHPTSKAAAREKLGLDPSLPVVLVVGGGLGMGPLYEAVVEIGNCSYCCQLLVVTGRNTELYHKLLPVVPSLKNRVSVFGFVENMNELMAASDLMVGKAGGLTCAEAMSCSLPVLVVNPIPGQEERNAEFLAARGAAVKVGEEKLAETVGCFLKDKSLLEKMSTAAALLAKPHSAYSAVRVIEEIALPKEL